MADDKSAPTAEVREALRKLPSVDEAVRELLARLPESAEWPRWALTEAVRGEIAELRRRLLESGVEPGASTAPEASAIRRRVRALLAPSLRPVLNATGVVLHTNLGRAPLGASALARLGLIAAGYSNLEYDLASRRRGSRHHHAAAILQRLCGAEDALVVNNNAAAVLLCLSALAQGRQVIVSRGELIEIGGSFRLPEVMAASGALLREVGTTNRTHLRDYRDAIGPETALLLKAHRSNFAQVGFTAEVDPEELVALGREHQLPAMFDLGSGSLIELSELGLPGETTVQRVVRQGFDLVTFSGDKLLGGPQAGIVVGRAELVGKLRGHPLMRALRPDKLTLAALEATLEAYRDGVAVAELPVLSMLAATETALRRRALRLRVLLGRGDPGSFTFTPAQVTSKVGGGALPLAAPLSWAVAINHPRWGADAIEERLRLGDPPVLAHIDEGRVLLDVRTIPDEQLPLLATTVAAALKDLG
jgi:L-seryl-tRNA(Ser) seleniumtransferase